MSNTARQSNVKLTKIPIWACVLIVLISTLVAFFLFGGARYIQNFSEVNMRHFYHEDDSSNWLVWLAYCFETGQLAGFVAFVVSVLTVTLINRRRN